MDFRINDEQKMSERVRRRCVGRQGRPEAQRDCLQRRRAGRGRAYAGAVKFHAGMTRDNDMFEPLVNKAGLKT